MASLIDNSSNVVLWQVGVLGDTTFKSRQYDIKGMPHLVQKLYQHYSPYHEVYVYEAALFPGVEPVSRKIPLWSLPQSGAERDLDALHSAGRTAAQRLRHHAVDRAAPGLIVAFSHADRIRPEALFHADGLAFAP